MNRDERILHLQGKTKDLEARLKEAQAKNAEKDRMLSLQSADIRRLEDRCCSLTADIERLTSTLRAISLSSDQALHPLGGRP